MSVRSETRVNAHEADTCERAAALRFGLERRDELHYDAVATDDSAQLQADELVEVKGCRVWIENGDRYGTVGRWNINRNTHRDLLEADGWYALAVYDLVTNDLGDDHVLLYALELVPASLVDRALPETDGRIVKLPWSAVIAALPEGAFKRGDQR